MAWVVELKAWDGAAEVTRRFAMGAGVALTDEAYAEGALLLWESPSQRIEIGAEGVTRITGDRGRIDLANLPTVFGTAGPLDATAAWIWQNRIARLYWVPARLWSERILSATGVLEQPVSGISGESRVSFELRDPRASLETPLQPVKYAGDNVGADGVEGNADLAGQPKPIVYGLVSNLSPPRVNESKLIYQVADRAIDVLCVRDGAVPLGAGVIRASLASMQASDPSSGSYDVYAGAEGTFIRLGSSPIFNVTCDADEAATEADQSHAQIWSRIRTERCGATVDAASVTAVDLLDAAGAGFYWQATTTQKDALDEVLGSFSGYEALNDDLDWSIGKLILPAGDPVLDLVALTPTTRMRATTRAIGTIDGVRPSYAPDGAPPYRVTLNWGRNYTVMNESMVAAAVSARLREKFAKEYRSVTVTDTSIWDPETSTGPWINAPEMTVNSAYQPGPDGRTSPGAEAEAQRLMDLLGPLRDAYQLQHVPAVGDTVRPGDVVRVTYPRRGLEAGALFRVLQYRLRVEKSVASAGMVLGLKSS